MQSPRVSVRLLEDSTRGMLHSPSQTKLASSPSFSYHQQQQQQQQPLSPRFVPRSASSNGAIPSVSSSRRPRSASPLVPRVKVEKVAGAGEKGVKTTGTPAALEDEEEDKASAESEAVWSFDDGDAVAAKAAVARVTSFRATGPLRFEGVVSSDVGKACITGGGAVYVAQVKLPACAYILRIAAADSPLCVWIAGGQPSYPCLRSKRCTAASSRAHSIGSLCGESRSCIAHCCCIPSASYSFT